MQFLNGQVNASIVLGLARTLAKLNRSHDFVPKDFNDECIRPKSLQKSNHLEGLFAQKCQAAVDDDDVDVCLNAMRQMEPADYGAMLSMFHERFATKQVVCHNDMHVFNILVSGNDDGSSIQSNVKDSSNNNNSRCICDWEMCCYGPRGTDPGKASAFPILCAMYHAVQGRREIAVGMLQLMETFWNVYVANMDTDDDSVVRFTC